MGTTLVKKVDLESSHLLLRRELDSTGVLFAALRLS